MLLVDASSSRSFGLFNKATKPRISTAAIRTMATCAQVIFAIAVVCSHNSATPNTERGEAQPQLKVDLLCSVRRLVRFSKPYRGRTAQCGQKSKVSITLLLAFGFGLHVLSSSLSSVLIPFLLFFLSSALPTANRPPPVSMPSYVSCFSSALELGNSLTSGSCCWKR